MKIFRGFQKVDTQLKNSVVTIGNFDGLHLGHRRIVQRAIERAREVGGPTLVYTFRPHPQALLRPDLPLALLTTYDEKAEKIAELSPDYLIEEPFSREFSSFAPEVFFRDVLIRRLNPSALVVGYDFGFGKGREGQLEKLKEFCSDASVQLEVISPQRESDQVISSSQIRKSLIEKNVENANELLGYRFFYRGVVIRGDQRGRTIGFPTANLMVPEKIQIPNGVYATWTRIGDQCFRSVTNIGKRPTFKGVDAQAAVFVETHIFDRQFHVEKGVELYGSQMQVEFNRYLRDEMKFDGIDSLKSQISSDISLAEKILS